MNAQPTPPGAAPDVPLLRLHLLGGFRATRGSGPPPAERWPRLTAQTLVKLLAVTPGHRLHREQVMDLCWPDAGPQTAPNNLRVALHAARRALEPELAPRAASSYLISDGALLLLDPATVWVDADHVEEAARSALASRDMTELENVLERFEGGLLPEDPYASWADARRTRLMALRVEVCLALATAHMAHEDLPQAAAAAERVLETNPAEEGAHRTLMDIALRQGMRRQALRQYHLCRDALDAELGVRPGPETERLHRAALAAAPTPAATGPALPAPLRGITVAPLRGRDDALRGLLAGGGPPVRLLTGEPGVGKTRLVAEAARRAAGSGTAVLWGAGHDAEGHTPYGAFAEALDGWLAVREVAERARIGAEYPDLAAFLPSLGQISGFGERSPEEERDRLFRATAGLLGELTAHRPVLVVLDDLHAADSGSYQLLSHLARRAAGPGSRLRFLVTYREEELPDTDPRRADLTVLVRQGLAVPHGLERLGKDACLAVARDAVGAAAPLDRVWELSLGNPLFAVELARALADAPEEGTATPEGVRQLVTERLARLDPDARRVVEALSVAGSETASSELLDVAAQGLHPPVTGAAATAALERAIGAALIEERPVVASGRHVPGLAFRHPLVRLTCYEGLSAVRRMQLHGAFAQAVRQRRPDAVDTLASHFTRADDPMAAEYLRLAAERASALYANDTADRYYQDLVARLDVDAARTRLAHSQVLRRMGRFDRAAEALRTALDEFVRRDDNDRAVLAAGYLAESLVRAKDSAAGRQILHDHRATSDTAPEPAAVHYLALSLVCCYEGRYDDGYAAARLALPAAEQVPGAAGQGLLARAYTLLASNLGLAGHFERARAAGDRALEPAEAYGDPQLLGTVLSTQRENARRAGRLHEAVGLGRRALDLAEHSGDPAAIAFERANLAELHLLLEETAPAAALADAAVTGAEADGSWCLPYALTAQARVLLRTGDLSGAVAVLDRAERIATDLEDRQAAYEVSTARAELALLAHRPDEALAVLDGHATDAPTLTAWAHLLAGQTESALRIARAETERAARSGERLAEVEARTTLGACLSRLSRTQEGEAEMAHASSLAVALPYPAWAGRLGRARKLLGETRMSTQP
ncbi:AAA family ATPase [Streptomyces sp. NRRL B-24572]|uniref:ATP-binding protein n=1 Tax=Streptomyces sp. NRRL B-24572 TaxID=1962156 RepID=UPI000A3605BE|nr:AAA family ATPase [Streptomyces sp. NRRL B-24572]